MVSRLSKGKGNAIDERSGDDSTKTASSLVTISEIEDWLTETTTTKTPNTHDFQCPNAGMNTEFAKKRGWEVGHAQY